MNYREVFKEKCPKCEYFDSCLNYKNDHVYDCIFYFEYLEQQLELKDKVINAVEEWTNGKCNGDWQKECQNLIDDFIEYKEAIK